MSSSVPSRPIDLLTPVQAAEYLGITLVMLQSLISQKLIPSYLYGRHLRFFRSELETWQRQRAA